ncbi:MAG: alpha/beta hydrolase, partial [Bdellovibrionaceae bacterium]|nr:alpha/beta hydrolase [Pseudobdellovibrionaceae bacterium]
MTLLSEPGPGPGATVLDRTVRASAQDAADAIRWLRANAATYNIDPDRIAIGGISAGAGVSLFTAYQNAGTLGAGAGGWPR